MKPLNCLLKIFYALWNRKYYIIFIIMLFLILGFIVKFYWKGNADNIFTIFLDPWIAGGTFIAAIFIFVQSTTKIWEDDLDKKLTVHFKVKNSKYEEYKYLLTCHETYLSSEGDIRQLAQQIGGQMTGIRFLDFYPYIDEKSAIMRQTSITDDKISEGKLIKLYEVTFYLRDYPRNERKEIIHQDYTVWWDNNPDKTIDNRKLTYDGLRCSPKSIQEAQRDYLSGKGYKKRDDENNEIISINYKMINFSNHPFNEKQTDEASRLLKEIALKFNDKTKYNIIEASQEIEYIPFPDIPAGSSYDELTKIITDYEKIIVEHKPMVVHIMGESTFCYRMIEILKSHNIVCIASTTERDVKEDGDKKLSTFKFIKFRNY